MKKNKKLHFKPEIFGAFFFSKIFNLTIYYKGNDD